ncbi:glycosyltransferase [Gordonia crocea]|uniref:Glycosyltransferase 2-like domain-containing protein n=1 Tax=Gordonia crocea TaxID=589162 RepID=A0A7I9UZL7_9ACTN|nr:glycosyltransferase [Gordonia crocea]GED98565.1 hypothetical protein nbrc107697_26040 [Gordonia crocea]
MDEIDRCERGGVVAVIVTHNRVGLLAEAIKSVLDQTVRVRRVIVVDNCSTDETWSYLKGSADRVGGIRTAANTGGAGGFARGIAWACELGAEAIWLMDDDAVAQPDCLEELLRARAVANGAPFVAPLVLEPGGALGPRNRPFLSADFPQGVAAARNGHGACLAASFVGPLIDGAAARATHAPLEDFFIWHDDTEYLARLATGGSGRYVPAAAVVHRPVGAGPGHFRADRARGSIRNLVWCVREAHSSAIGVRAWLELLRVVSVQQVGTGQSIPTALGAVVAGVWDGIRSLPRHRTLAEVLAESREGDELIRLAVAGNSSAAPSDYCE